MFDAKSADPRGGLTFVVGAVWVILVLVVVLCLDALHHRLAASEIARKEQGADTAESSRLRAEHEGQLEGYRWVDEEKRVVAIPIEQAMELVAQDDGVR